jgi:hypothetical protein
MSWVTRLRGVLQSKRLDRELDDELNAHIAMRTRDNFASGMSEKRHVGTRAGVLGIRLW